MTIIRNLSLLAEGASSTGVLDTAHGGTNSTSSPTAGGVGYGTGTAIAITPEGTAGQVLTSAGAGIPTWTTPSAGGGSSTYTRTSFTATAGQTTFTATYTVGYVEVYLNGIFLNGTDYAATNGTSVVLVVAASVGDTLETVAYSVTSVVSDKSIAMSLVFGG